MAAAVLNAVAALADTCRWRRQDQRKRHPARQDAARRQGLWVRVLPAESGRRWWARGTGAGQMAKIEPW